MHRRWTSPPSRSDSKRRGRAATTPRSPPSSSRSPSASATRPTSTRARTCSTSRPAAGTPRSRPPVWAARDRHRLRPALLSSEVASAPRPSGSRSSFRRRRRGADPVRATARSTPCCPSFGSMFAPDQAARPPSSYGSTRPGGTIALASWTPEGFLGEMFRTIAEHVPPPAGARRRCSGAPSSSSSSCSATTCAGAPPADVHVPVHVGRGLRRVASRAYYGPTLKAVEAAGPAMRSPATCATSSRSWNRLAGRRRDRDARATYLESVGTRV